jgi:purine-cytosine permease-like protein
MRGRHVAVVSGEDSARERQPASLHAPVSAPPGMAPIASPPSAALIERHGIESIPDAERNASILDFARICWGGSNSLPTAVLGAFPIMFGLSFWQGVDATLIGLGIGALVLAPMAIFGPISGTNNAVSSSAHFGVVGRIVGSFLSLLTAIAFFAISVWSCGDAVAGAAQRVFHVPQSAALVAVAYAAFAFSVLVICIYGFRLMLLVNKVAVIASSLLFVCGLIAFWGDFDASFPGMGLRWGQREYAAAFISSTLVVLANPISYGAFLGDWARYLPRTVSKPALLAATVAAQLLTLLPFLFGLITASIIARRAPDYLVSADYAGGLITVSPGWFCAPLLGLAILSGMSTGVTSLYGTGLDFSSVLPRLSRPRATMLIGTLACVLIFVGRFYFSLFGSLSTFVSLIVVTTTPWMVIMMIGYVVRRGFYMPQAMQVFNRGQTGGAYWFTGGWNVAGMSAWIISSAIALMMVNIPGHTVGWLGNLAGGVDLSLLAALVLPAFLYPLCLWLFPEPRAVYGPAGPRFVRAIDRPIAPIVQSSPRI